MFDWIIRLAIVKSKSILSHSLALKLQASFFAEFNKPLYGEAY